MGIMQFLIVGSLFVAGASAQLVHYPNGAVAPYDPNNAAATAAHLQATAEAGKLINPFGVHTTGLYAPLGYHYGKREAQVLDPATNLVTYPNGAVAPFDPNVAPPLACTLPSDTTTARGRRRSSTPPLTWSPTPTAPSLPLTPMWPSPPPTTMPPRPPTATTPSLVPPTYTLPPPSTTASARRRSP